MGVTVGRKDRSGEDFSEEMSFEVCFEGVDI
jgi:hypothetical protein